MVEIGSKGEIHQLAVLKVQRKCSRISLTEASNLNNISAAPANYVLFIKIYICGETTVLPYGHFFTHETEGPCPLHSKISRWLKYTTVVSKKLSIATIRCNLVIVTHGEKMHM